MSAHSINEVAVIRHLAFEDLGLIQNVLEKRNINITTYDVGVDDIELAILNSDLVILLGGPISVYETKQYPFLIDEINAVKKRLSADKPTLGICLGAQLMAVALGAKVYPGETKEIGWSKVTLTPQGARSCLSFLDHIPVLHWHGDTFDIPDNAECLASTTAFKNQAFSINNNILALQFHVEVDPHRIEQWLIGHSCELAQIGIEPQTIRSQTEQVINSSNDATYHMMSWIDQLEL
jgi:GMP synthase (glutamine-hydrolysing)